jgi:hypothetical protein
LVTAQNRQKQYADQHRQPKAYQVGDEVLLTNAHFPLTTRTQVRKLAPRWLGPFRITAVISPVAYKLALPSHMRIHPVFHVSQLKDYNIESTQFPGRHHPRPPPVMIDDEPEWEVDRILNHRFVRRGRGQQLQYKILWKGYPEHDASWRPASDLPHCQDVIREYHQQRNEDVSV